MPSKQRKFGFELRGGQRTDLEIPFFVELSALLQICVVTCGLTY